MFKKLREKRRKEWEQRIADAEQRLADYERLLEDIKNNYLPLRERCIDTIYKHEMNYYHLRDVFGAAYKDDKLRVIINKIETNTWDAKPSHKFVCTLLDETIQLRCFDRESFVADLILKLEDPTKEIERAIGYYRNYIEAKRNDYN